MLEATVVSAIAQLYICHLSLTLEHDIARCRDNRKCLGMLLERCYARRALSLRGEHLAIMMNGVQTMVRCAESLHRRFSVGSLAVLLVYREPLRTNLSGLPCTVFVSLISGLFNTAPPSSRRKLETSLTNEV